MDGCLSNTGERKGSVEAGWPVGWRAGLSGTGACYREGRAVSSSSGSLSSVHGDIGVVAMMDGIYWTSFCLRTIDLAI